MRAGSTVSRPLRLPCRSRVGPSSYEARFPVVPTRIEWSGRATQMIEAVIDTGASFTAFSASHLGILGLEWGELDLSKRVCGVGGHESEWRGTRLDLIFGGTPPAPRIVLREVKVFFSRNELLFPALIGQDDALYRLQFELCNRDVSRRGRTQPPSFRLIAVP